MVLTTRLFLFLLALTISNGLYINLDGKRDYCFFVTVAEGVNITISYVVSGYNENLVSMKVFSPSENPIAMVDMKKENFIDLFILEGGKQKICFGNIDGTSKVLAFDFMEAEKRKDAEIVTKENLDSVVKELRKNFKQLQMVYKNQQFQQIRDEVHAESISQTESRVKWCSVFKIVILILICVSQIYILTSFFRDKKRVAV